MRTGRTAVYRMYDADNVLLYIGIAKSFGQRWAQHACEKPWWPDVKRQTVEWYDSREDAEDAETVAIKAEKPKYNIKDANDEPVRERRRPALVPLEPEPVPAPSPDQHRPVITMGPGVTPALVERLFLFDAMSDPGHDDAERAAAADAFRHLLENPDSADLPEIMTRRLEFLTGEPRPLEKNVVYGPGSDDALPVPAFIRHPDGWYQVRPT